MTAHRPHAIATRPPWKEPAHMHGGLAGPAGATSIFDESKSENGAPAFQNCNRRRCAYCIVNHRRPKRARGGYRIACRGWSNSAGLLCPGPHPRCGTRRFTTRVAQVRAAAAPCRRFQPPNAGDYATSPRHRAVAWLKETHEKNGLGGYTSVANLRCVRPMERPAAGTTRRGKIPYRSGILTTCTLSLVSNMHRGSGTEQESKQRNRGRGSLRNEMVARFW